MSLVSRPLRLRLAASFRGAYDLHLSLYETFKSQRSMPPFRWRKTRKDFIKSPFPCQPQSVSFFRTHFLEFFPLPFGRGKRVETLAKVPFLVNPLSQVFLKPAFGDFPAHFSVAENERELYQIPGSPSTPNRKIFNFSFGGPVQHPRSLGDLLCPDRNMNYIKIGPSKSTANRLFS